MIISLWRQLEKPLKFTVSKRLLKYSLNILSKMYEFFAKCKIYNIDLSMSTIGDFDTVTVIVANEKFLICLIC